MEPVSGEKLLPLVKYPKLSHVQFLKFTRNYQGNPGHQYRCLQGCYYEVDNVDPMQDNKEHDIGEVNLDKGIFTEGHHHHFDDQILSLYPSLEMCNGELLDYY